MFGGVVLGLFGLASVAKQGQRLAQRCRTCGAHASQIALSNPKAILFFAAFFPKFVDASLPQAPQYLVLTVSFFVIETVWQLIYTVSGKALAAWLQQGRRLQNLNRVCGAIFILIAVSLLWDSMHVLLG